MVNAKLKDIASGMCHVVCMSIPHAMLRHVVCYF